MSDISWNNCQVSSEARIASPDTWLSMWVSPQWQGFSEHTVFLSHWSLKGFIYKYRHASNLKTITPLEGQVRKKMLSFLQRKVMKSPALTRYCTKPWAERHLRTIVYYSHTIWTSNSYSWCGCCWGDVSPACWGAARGKQKLKKGFSSFSHLHNWTYFYKTAILNTKLDNLPAKSTQICIELALSQ